MVIAIAAVNRFATDWRKRNFGGHAAAIAGDADHRALARSAIAFAGGFPFIAAVLAALRFVCETTFCVERLFILAEYELLSAVSAIQILVIKRVHDSFDLLSFQTID